VFESAAWIFIDKPADYITFRATMLAPRVMLSMHVDALEMSKTKQAGAWQPFKRSASGRGEVKARPTYPATFFGGE
jgi:hypothetical protein